MSIYDYLRQVRQDIPSWLAAFRQGDAFSADRFFQSRTVFYPGSGDDGHAVKVFGSTHSAHCFVYADYGVSQASLERQLEQPAVRFRGYQTLARLQLAERDLAPQPWVPHVRRDEIPANYPAMRPGLPFGFLEVLERRPELNDDHGPARLAVLFLGADGIATYDALFCQRHSAGPPFAMLLQDHGFGGNYATFGQGGLMESIAERCHVYPDYLLVAKHTAEWKDYERIPDVDGDPGGMHGNLRFLYRRRTEHSTPE